MILVSYMYKIYSKTWGLVIYKFPYLYLLLNICSRLGYGRTYRWKNLLEGNVVKLLDLYQRPHSSTLEFKFRLDIVVPLQNDEQCDSVEQGHFGKTKLLPGRYIRAQNLICCTEVKSERDLRSKPESLRIAFCH